MTGERPHAVPPKTVQEIASEWDAIVSVRARQLAGDTDVSYHEVLTPAVMRLLGKVPDGSTVLDVGCGTGFLTAKLARPNVRVLGIDPSASSIREAEAHASRLGITTLEFEASPVETLAPPTSRFDFVVANMTLMDLPDLGGATRAISQLAAESCVVVWTITHPWFWPCYWGYEGEPWFDYSREIFIESEFRISKERTRFSTTHVHRPLEAYVSAFRAEGFSIEVVEEPKPDTGTMSMYPDPWAFPRFLAVRCSR